MRAVLLLHGAGGSVRATFDPTGWRAALAAAGRNVIAIDLPGHGPSPQPRDPAAYADLASQIAPHIPAEGCDAIGFSLGAKLVLELAARRPQMFGRIVLGGLGDNLFAPERVGEAVAAALEHGPGADTPPPVLAFLAQYDPGPGDPLALAAVMRRPPNPIIAAGRLASVRHPILVVNGASDPVATPDTRLRGELPAARFVELPGIGHFDLPHAAAFQALALTFLARGDIK